MVNDADPQVKTAGSQGNIYFCFKIIVFIPCAKIRKYYNVGYTQWWNSTYNKLFYFYLFFLQLNAAYDIIEDSFFHFAEIPFYCWV